MPQSPRPSSPTPRCIAIQTRFILENKQTKKLQAYLHDDLKFVPDLLVGGLKAAAVAVGRGGASYHGQVEMQDLAREGARRSR